MFGISGEWHAGENLMTCIILVGRHWNLLKKRQTWRKVSVGALIFAKNSLFWDCAEVIWYIRPSLSIKANLFCVNLTSITCWWNTDIWLVSENIAVQVTSQTARANGLCFRLGILPKKWPKQQTVATAGSLSLFAVRLCPAPLPCLPPAQKIS